jgi:hypothetical protein
MMHVLPLPTRCRLREIATVRLGEDGDGLYDDVAHALGADAGTLRGGGGAAGAYAGANRPAAGRAARRGPATGAVDPGRAIGRSV